VTERFRVVPAAYLLLRREAGGHPEVLLQLRRGTGYFDEHWAAGAAGHVERGESVFAAACREAVEELGITVDPADLLVLSVLHRTDPAHRPVDERVDVFFSCSRWAGTPVIRETDKAGELRWFRLAELPSPVVPHELLVLQGLRTGLLPPLLTVGFDGPG